MPAPELPQLGRCQEETARAARVDDPQAGRAVEAQRFADGARLWPGAHVLAPDGVFHEAPDGSVRFVGHGDSLTSSPTGEPDPSYPAFRGGKGGNGGGGGSGGGGGGGCGGPAIGIYAAGYGTATLPTWDTANDFLTLGTGGAGGLGGFSLGNPGGTGSDGTAADTNF